MRVRQLLPILPICGEGKQCRPRRPIEHGDSAGVVIALHPDPQIKQAGPCMAVFLAGLSKALVLC